MLLSNQVIVGCYLFTLRNLEMFFDRLNQLKEEF